jgi:hypothetical protein
MKKMLAKLSALGVVAVALVGCQEDNDKKAMVDPTTGKAGAAAKAPPGTARTSADFMKQQQGNYKSTGTAGGAATGYKAPGT